MPKLLRTVLAVVLGFVVGSAVNMGLIMLGGELIPPPAGAKVSTMEGLKASLHLFEPKHFIFPFLAHAVGTLAGAFAAAMLASGRSAIPAYVVGCLFLLGGIANVFVLAGPAWFNTVDIVFAYLPAAWLAHALAMRVSQRGASGG